MHLVLNAVSMKTLLHFHLGVFGCCNSFTSITFYTTLMVQGNELSRSVGWLTLHCTGAQQNLVCVNCESQSAHFSFFFFSFPIPCLLAFKRTRTLLFCILQRNFKGFFWSFVTILYLFSYFLHCRWEFLVVILSHRLLAECDDWDFSTWQFFSSVVSSYSETLKR